MNRFTIQGRLDGLNEYTNANRTNRFAGAKMKERNEKLVLQGIRATKLVAPTKYPIKLKITWYEPNSRRDVDNVTFATKFIQDTLVKSGVLQDDSQKFINSVEHEVKVDKNNPRIEVELLEE